MIDFVYFARAPICNWEFPMYFTSSKISELYTSKQGNQPMSCLVGLSLQSMYMYDFNYLGKISVKHCNNYNNDANAVYFK